MRDVVMLDDDMDDLVAVIATGADLSSPDLPPPYLAPVDVTPEPAEIEDIRHQCNLRGRVFMDSWAKDASLPDRPITCRIHKISPFSVTIASPLRIAKGARVRLGIEEIGAMHGRVTRAIGALLTVETELAPRERARLSAKISWMERRKTYSLADNRRGNRFHPRNTNSRLVMPTGETMPCDIIDLSSTGAAVNADVVPEVGMVLAVGKVVARVVRHLELGFAVQFIKAVDRDAVEAAVTVADNENGIACT